MKEFTLIFLALFSLSADAQDALPGEDLETCTSCVSLVIWYSAFSA
jgi:hypothetical protein